MPIVFLALLCACLWSSGAEAQEAPPAQQAQPAQQQSAPPQGQPVLVQEAPPPAPVYYQQQPAPVVYQPAPYPAYGAQPTFGPNGEVPAGYQVERRPRLGMIISGAALFGAVWLITTMVAVPVGVERDNPDALRLAIPIFGPFIGINEFGSEGTENFVDGVLAFNGLLQAVGATVLIIGIATPKRRLVPSYAEGPRVTPTFGLGSLGLRVDF